MKAPRTSGSTLRVADLEKSFGPKEVLRGVNLTVRASEFVAVVGKSGCGKSTLLRLIAGLETLRAGSITLGEESASSGDPRLRMIFQDHRLLPWKSVLDNVALGLPKGSRDEARNLLAQVGLAKHAEDLPGTLSGGEKQRVSLARALASRPELLLFDEPLGALDALTRIEMQGLIERLWREQRFTALLITHDVDEAIVLADRIVVLDEGAAALEVDVDLPRPRPRTGAAFDAIKERVLGRILREARGSALRPAARERTPEAPAGELLPTAPPLRGYR